MWQLFAKIPTPSSQLSTDNSDAMPTVAAELRSLLETQCRHSRLAFRAEIKIADVAEALVLKKNMSYDDLPPLPYGTLTCFNPASILHPRFCCPNHESGIRQPLTNQPAITLLRTVLELALKIDAWARSISHDAGIVSSAVYSSERPRPWLGFGPVPTWTPDAALLEVVRRWSGSRDREDELEMWVDMVAQMSERVQEMIGGADILVFDRAHRGAKRDGWASGVGNPILPPGHVHGVLLRRHHRWANFTL